MRLDICAGFDKKRAAISMILVTSRRTEPKYQLKVKFDLQILAISEAQILNEHIIWAL